MNKFKNLKIGVKLVVGFIIVAIIAGVVGVAGIFFTNEINKADTELYEKNAIGMNYISQASIKFQRIRVGLGRVMLDNSQKEEVVTLMTQFSEEIESYLTDYEKNCLEGEEDQQIINELKKEWTNFSEQMIAIIECFDKNDYDGAKLIYQGKLQEASDALQTVFDSASALNTQAAKNKADSNDDLTNQALQTMLFIITIAMVVAVLLGIIVSRIISVPINKMVAVAKKISIGDVNVEIDIYSKDETGILAQAMKDMIDNIREQALLVERIASGDLTTEVIVRSEKDLLNIKLKEMVEKNNEVLRNIAFASEQVATGSKQVSDSSIALSQGATEQASSIEQLTTSLEEISSQTKMNAQNANQANELAKVAENNAVQGNARMKEMQSAMDDINLSSTNISKIIKVIDDIAFQTNILALNAAVEAARAGHHGKGFAVVAEEVRNLAARSANAAKETTDLIEGSIGKVNAGTQIANETAGALNKIVEDVAKAAGLVGDIAIASNEQATGIAQINQGIMQVSQVVQTNSATAEESAAASEELSSQAELLRESVSKFKLKVDVGSSNKYSELNPEILKMLEGMTEKSPKDQFGRTDYLDKSKNAKIILNEAEFGKY